MAVVAEIGDIEIDIDDEAPRHAVLVLPLRLRGGTKIDLRQGADDSHPSARDRAAANAALPRECTACGLRKALQRLLSEHGASTKDCKRSQATPLSRRRSATRKPPIKHGWRAPQSCACQTKGEQQSV